MATLVMATLVERVRALQGGLPLDAAALKQRKADVAAGAAVTADNLAERITQAVETADDAALDGCLSAPVGGAAIRRAAAVLPGPVAEAVLAAAYARFRRRPGRGRQLAAWIRALLHSHAAHLQQSKDAASTLGALQGGIAAAAATQGPLLSLSGRLQLALAQQRGGPVAAPPPLQFAADDAPQREPVAADAMADPVAAPAAESLSNEDEGDDDGDAWATDSSGDEDAGSGSEADSSEEEE